MVVSACRLCHSLYMKRILLIDDIIDVQALVAGLLRNRGAQIDTASNGNVASKLLNDNKYDLVITDLNMPIEDGFSIIHKMRNINARTKDIPIIVISAGNTFNKDKALNYDQSIESISSVKKLAILKKPFSKQQLLEKVCKAFDVEFDEDADDDLWFGDHWQSD